jgi:hypothetical protein
MSRWLSIAYGCVLCLSLAAVNIFPRYPFTARYEHGWPLVYMTRTIRVYRPELEHHGFWPFWNPPLAQFEPTYLIADIAIAVALVSASAYANYRILIREPFPITLRISLLQWMFGLTLFGAALALFGQFVVGFLLLQLPIWIVYWSMFLIFLGIADRRNVMRR